MANAKLTIEKVHKNLKKELEEAIAEIEDVVEVAAESFAELKGVAADAGLGDAVADIVVPKLPLPWYVPQFVAKIAVKNAVDKAIARATKQ